MKATVDDLKRYAFCPKFYEQQGSLKSLHDESAKDFTALLTFLFRRDMETEVKQNWNAVEKRWVKIFYQSHNAADSPKELQLFNRSLVAIHKFHKWYLKQPTDVVAVNYTLATEVYNHQIIGEIPALLTGKDGLSLIMTEPITDPPAAKVSPGVRYLSMALGEEFPVKTVHNVALIDYQIFHVETFEPSARYWELAMLDFVNLMQSMQGPLTYPNTISCPVCPIQMTCEVLKGNG
tara:strand:+ start:698 stop:1402 length:705 start_codon:yes stop_codon:yes gene_type:complete